MSRTYITCTWQQVGHLDQDEIDEMFKALPPHQRDARSKGIPSLGSGAIYPVPESDFVIQPFVLPKHYKHAYGLNVQPADNAVEAGLYAVWERLSTGRLKVFNTCTSLLDEYRIYRRDEKGRIVKDNDHIMDALRYLVMSGINIARQDVPAKRKSLNGFLGGTFMSG